MHIVGKFKKTSITGLSAQTLHSKTDITLKMLKNALSWKLQGKSVFLLDLREKSHPFIYSLKPNLTAQTWSRSTVCHLLRRVKISPSLINTLGFQKKKRPELHRGTNAHVCRHRADVYGTGSHGKGGLMILERRDRVREGPPTAHSSQVCFVEKGVLLFGSLWYYSGIYSAGINLACVKQEPLRTEAMQT